MIDYCTFVRFAILEDDRNVFGEGNGISGLPEPLCSFYGKCNPIDVEVMFPNLGAVKFYSVEELLDLQNDYRLPNGCIVFATCNGDPIFVNNGSVMTSLHETFCPELLAVSFDDFLNSYILSKR